ncbi:hypothetical protein DF185_09535 [Marinifilum breve]|uniref:Uncharacterized protein n=1 Tax=Marinifilum breve TaxID=2184082 RepID=A0A2V4A2Y7_9BACT|nr:choice-of-anchor J domain-containing protein [Marinifilum breve]PXY01700.1 hypothetical protein DF185_09535 [Marinifilum breve]
MILKRLKYKRMISAGMLISILLLSSTGAWAVNKSSKKNKGKKVVLFEDGWQELKPVEGESQTGNFSPVSLQGEPEQADNKKWNAGWGNWSVTGVDGESKRGVIMVPNRMENDDYLVSTEIELKNCKKAELLVEAYSKYGTDNVNELKVLISANYNGDVETAQWDELWMESIHKQKQAVERKISLKKYLGKNVVIAFRSVQSGKSVKNMTRTTFLSKVNVTAVCK